ncbi:MAG: hypothetical protein JO360_04365 [Acidobacteria bacterium]|nr:hypothetical protein [Acidobacteriota bacterium]
MDDLWLKIGDLSQGINGVTAGTTITPARMVRVLAAQGERNTPLPDGPEYWKRIKYWLKQLRAWLKRCRLWLNKHSVDWGAILLFVTLWLFISYTLRQHQAAIIAPSELRAGHKLERKDLVVAKVSPGKDYFTDPGELDGLIISKDLPAGRPVQFQDVLRLQLVATKELPPGTVITNDNSSPAWSTYQQGALISPGEAHELKVYREVKAGEVLLSKFTGR